MLSLQNVAGNRAVTELVQRAVIQREMSDLPPIFLGLFAGMDNQGEQILGTYLFGGGGRHEVYDDEIWSDYMKAHNGLRLQILAELLAVVRDLAAKGKKGRFPIAERFHAEFTQNSGLSGYALLHGSNKDVGDFQLLGWADVQDAVDPAEGDFDIEMDLRFVFNDIVDPNRKYVMDRIRSAAASVALFGQPEKYELSIHWGSSCLAEIRKGKPPQLSGYPSDVRRGVRPLPRGKLNLGSG